MERIAGDLSDESKDRHESLNSVISNDDLLIEILLRLPKLSLLLLKSVSKRWLSLIKSTNFPRKLDPPCGLFLKFRSMLPDSTKYDFLPLDIRIPSSTSFTFGHKAPPGNPEILQSCNGLVLCFSSAYKELYVYNPSIYKMFKMIPQQHNVTFHKNSIVGGMRMAFDPTKSPYYKIIHAELMLSNDDVFWIKLHTYSSETGVWTSVCGDRFPDQSFTCFHDGVYWDDAIHWVNGFSWENLHFKLDISNERPVLTSLKPPLTLNGMRFQECKMFASCGCLLLVGKNDRDLYIYEMRNRCSEWSVKYIVNLSYITLPLSFQGISSNVSCIVLGEREDDSFMVMKFSQKAVLYKFVSKALCKLSANSLNGDLVVDGLDLLKAIEKEGSNVRVTSNPDVVDSC